MGLMWIIPVSTNEKIYSFRAFTGGEIREDTEIKFTKSKQNIW